MPQQAPPLSNPIHLSGGVDIQVPIFPPDYIPYINMMGSDPWWGGGKPTLAQSQFDWTKVLDTAGLTGMYNDSPTLAFQNLQHDWGLSEAGVTGMYKGAPTLAMLGLQQGDKDNASRENIANIGAGAQKYAADTSMKIAELENKARMLEIEATRNYQEGLLKIQQGQLDLGYAQLAESKRQFDQVHALDIQKQQLAEREFALTEKTTNYQMAANPRNWIAWAYAKNQLTPPANTAVAGTPAGTP